MDKKSNCMFLFLSSLGKYYSGFCNLLSLTFNLLVFDCSVSYALILLRNSFVYACSVCFCVMFLQKELVIVLSKLRLLAVVCVAYPTRLSIVIRIKLN